MNKTVSRLEITDICDELSEDLRRELIEKQVICVSKLDSNRNEFNELKNEIKRLESDLKFANKCLITLNKFKKYLNEIRPQIENVLDLRQIQELSVLENEYKIMFKKVNEISFISRLRSICSGNGSDSENEYIVNNTNDSDHNVYIKEKITEFNEYPNTNQNIAEPLHCDYTGCRRTFNFTEDLHRHRKSCHSLERDQSSIVFENIDPNDSHSNDCNYEPISGDNYSSSDEITNGHKIVIRFPCDYTECDFVAKNNLELKRHKSKHSFLSALNSLQEKRFPSNYTVKGCKTVLNPIVTPYVCAPPDGELVGETHRKPNLDKYRNHERGAEYFKFKCIYCNFRCKFQTDLKKHKINKHSVKHLTYECTDCGKGFATSFQRTIHVNRSHKNLHKYKCDLCSYSAARPTHLKQHKSRHENWFKCDWPQCGFFGSSEDKLKIHNFIHTGVRPFPCTWPECDQSFHKKVSLSRHLREHENNGNPLNKTSDENNSLDSLQEKRLPFKCTVKGCDKRYGKKQTLKRHLIYSTNHFEHGFDPNLKLKCDDCPFRCDSEGWMKLHLRVHSNEFNCQFCDKQYKYTDGLAIHLKNVHNFVQTFKCSVEGCHQVFTNDYKRSIHLSRDHKIRKTYPCDYIGCDFVAKTKSVLTDHKLMHTGEVPYVCDRVGCDFVGRGRKQLDNHKAYKHKPWKYRCDLCGFQSDKRNRLNEHKIVKHTTDKPFKCGYCVKEFKLQSLLDGHVKRIHLGIQFKCTFPGCGQSFKNKDLRYKHMHIVHIQKHRCDWPECDFIATCRSKLVVHKYTHTRQTPFVCDWPDCGFVGRTNNNLKHHRYRHTGERPYPCTWPGCGKNFRTEPALTTHMRWHNNEKCYSCEWPGCDYATHDRGSLRHHKFGHNKNMTAKTKTNKRLNFVIKTNNISIKKTSNKRNARKPEEPKSDSGSDYSD